ncbi:MAG: hypothetical protein K6F80_07150, partial [Oscillospiraceae bacterium]|nr:hypothetical protein [Oscillospiraceae bacterium]
FSGKSEYYSEDVLRCEACMFCYKDLEYILYPFQKRFRDHIENGKCTIDELTMTAEQTYDPQTHTNRPEKLIVSGFANYPIFIIGADEKQIQLTYRFSFQREYDSSSISYLNTIPSFSMYPDVALEQEHLCRKFIYFTNSSCIQSSTENSSERNVILNQPECFGDLFDRNTDIAMHISREQYRFSVKEHCCHLLPVFEKDHCLGYVLNLRTKVTDYPPLLRRGGIPLQLELTPVNRGEDNGVMHIYVDYGSRSSAIAYRVGTTGQLQTKVITRNGRMVRQLLGVYAPERYHNFLDFDPLIRSVESIPSCIPENDLTDSSEILPFHRLLLSYRLHESEQEGMHLRYHRKNSSLRCRIPDNAQIPYQRHDNRGRGGNDDIGYVTLYSLCYLAVLYAVSLNCSDVMLYPVVSADHDMHKLISSMNQITEALQSFFALRIKHPMESPDSFMLRESLLVSNPVQAVPNVMTISVYIGDDRTEMTAVRYLDQNHRRVCAESSLPYGGRDLLYGVLYDALGNCISQKEAESFLLGIDGKLSFLSWKPEHEVLVRELVKSICKKFYANSDRIGKPRDDSWQACFDELLRYASIRIGTPDNPQDIKAKADLLIRCGILMPVICDFLDVAAANCEEPPTTVQLCFYGGAAEIIRLADAMTGSAEDGFLKTAERYLNQGRTYPCYISLSDSNSKSQVLNGMSLICTASGNDTEKLIMQNGVIFPLSQDMNPKISIVIPGSLRETVLKQFGFRSIDNQADIANNLEIRKNPKNFLPADLWDDTDTHSFKVYLSALRETFLRQKDVYDFTKTSFITEATFLTRKSNSDFLLSDHAEVSTFLPASEAEIYPEMLRNAAYLFETIRLLSEKYGNGFHEKYSGKDHSTYHFFC